MYSWVAKAYQSTCPGRTEIPGEKLCTLAGLTGQNRLSRDIIVSKFTEKQECGATETSKECKEEKESLHEQKNAVGVECYSKFDEMGLKTNLLRGIYSLGYEHPSFIQQRAIVPVYQGHDCICQAQSGTGKTAAFSTAILQLIDASVREPQAIVLSPTRHLAQQTHKVMKDLALHMDINVHLLIGGLGQPSNRAHASMLADGVHVVVGTPGRVNQMVAETGALRTERIKILVIDEADEMLDMGFKDQVYDLIKYLPEEAQVCLFSATMPQEALEITEKFMRDPVRILIKKEEVTLDGIDQYFVDVQREEYKLDCLCDLYESLTISQAIIFCRTKRKVDWLLEKMSERDFTCSALHGEMDQRDRDLVVEEFRSGSSRVLLTTDCLARGFDCQQVNLVINFDLPVKRADYIHRIGRSGRFGRKGVAINFITASDIRQMRDIEGYYHSMWTELPQNLDISN